MNLIKILQIFIIGLLFIIVSFACNKHEPVVTQSDNEEIPDQEMWNFDVKVTKNGKLDAHLKAGHMLYFSDKEQSVMNQGVLVDFYDKEGNQASTLTSDSGLFNEKNQDVKAIRNVIVNSDSGVTLYTEELAFDQGKEKIFTERDVKITTTKGDTFYGTGFISDPQLKFWEIKKLRGTAHKSVDLSPEQFKKEKESQKDSTGAVIDSLKSEIPDTVEINHEIVQ
jgi:LPS export ABC transporter protein LptC